MLAHLSRYTQRIAISKQRLVANAWRRENLATLRALLHVLPAADATCQATDALVASAQPTFVCPNCGAAIIIVETVVLPCASSTRFLVGSDSAIRRLILPHQLPASNLRCLQRLPRRSPANTGRAETHQIPLGSHPTPIAGGTSRGFLHRGSPDACPLPPRAPGRVVRSGIRQPLTTAAVRKGPR